MPKCSIILTSYNRPEYLQEAIESVFKQTMSDWELVIVDSSSDPRIHAIFHAIRRDPKVILIYDPRSVGKLGKVGRAWNMAIDIAQGEYIAFLDDDNHKKAQFCEKMSNFLGQHQEWDAVACLSQFIDANGHIIKQRFREPIGANKDSILEFNQVDSGELMVRRNVFNQVGYFDERLTTSEDWDMMIRIFQGTNGIAVMKEELVEYRIHEHQRLNRTVDVHEASLLVIKKKQYGQKLRISYIVPDDKHLTPSQKQVCEGIKNALPTIPFVEIQEIATITNYNTDRVKKSQFILLPSVLNLKIEEMEKLESLKIPLVTLHMEDTQGFSQTTKRDRYADWIVANDIATFDKLVGMIKDENKIQNT